MSNHNCSCGLCFWVWCTKTKTTQFLWPLWFNEKSISIVKFLYQYSSSHKFSYSWVCNNRVVYNKSALWGNFGKYKRPALEVVIINVLDHMSCKYYKCLAWNNCLGLQWMSCTKHWSCISKPNLYFKYSTIL